ncbi:hypothetical protein THAOC_23729 [Thalassiosira oceanica]|uniref:Uncharacterized protein n=1 Tax=Thalassiosira oceanica TaxID=159749 RepID=K0RRF3_THAOC|nr:hypothetical protein THAOC_23729 [Thalassiosira oceanica]|eukprot:EJK56388.1 hypothetical protein THAOC_23729 [Thalassiosira oceanica]
MCQSRNEDHEPLPGTQRRKTSQAINSQDRNSLECASGKTKHDSVRVGRNLTMQRRHHSAVVANGDGVLSREERRAERRRLGKARRANGGSDSDAFGRKLRRVKRVAKSKKRDSGACHPMGV